MKQRAHIDIAAAPELIWPLVADPEWMPGWNEKIVSTRALGARQPALAANYEFMFRMSKSKESTVAQATIREFEALQLVEWVYSGTSGRKSWTVIDRFRLESHGNTTRLHRFLDISKAPLPVWIRPVVWFVFKFGRPVGQTNLQRIRELVETA